MKVSIKLVALLLCLILAIKAAPKGNGKEGAGENEGAEAGEAGGEEGGEAGEQGETGKGEAGEVGEAEMGEAGEGGEMGEEEGVTEGGEVGFGENSVTVKSTTTIVKFQTPTAVTAETPTNEEPEATSFMTEAVTAKQRTGVSGSTLPEVVPSSPDKKPMPTVTQDDFNYLDKNGDGSLDYKELFLGQNNFNSQHLNSAFRISDKNFDGVVDQLEFFRHPLSWGRVVAEKQIFAKDISTSGTDASGNLTGQPDVTPTAEQTYTASPDGTSPQLPEGDVITTVPSAEQDTTGLTAVDQQSSVPTDTSTSAHVSVVDKANGGQTVAVPKVSQGQKDGANEKTGSQVGGKEGAVTGSKNGHPTQGTAAGRPLGTGGGSQPPPRKGGAVAGSSGDQAGMVTGQTDQTKTGAGSSGDQAGMVTGQTDLTKTGAGVSGCQPKGGPCSVGGHGQKGQYGQKNGQTGPAGSVGSHATAAGKMGGHSMSHKTIAGTRANGVQTKVSMHPIGKTHGRTEIYSPSKSEQASWSSKQQGHAAKVQYHRWDGRKWVKADAEQEVARRVHGSFSDKSKSTEYNGIAKSAGMEKKYFPDQRKESTNVVTHSEEEDDEESSNEGEENKKKDKNIKRKDDESEDKEDKDENDRK